MQEEESEGDKVGNTASGSTLESTWLGTISVILTYFLSPVCHQPSPFQFTVHGENRTTENGGGCFMGKRT